MATVIGNGPFADAVRRVLEYAKERGVDLSGVMVTVVEDPSVPTAVTQYDGRLRYAIRYNPRYARDAVLASHEAGHVAYFAWAEKAGLNVGDIITDQTSEALAQALAEVASRQLFNRQARFFNAPLNLTELLPQRYLVGTGGRKIPVWSDDRRDSPAKSYDLRVYQAGLLFSPYFYNVTNWSHVFGNVTKVPVDKVIETVHTAWERGHVETVPGWGAVWRTQPAWTPEELATLSQNKGDSAKSSGTHEELIASTQNKSSGSTQQTVAITQGLTTDVPLPPSSIKPNFADLGFDPIPPEWNRYINNRSVLVAVRNWVHYGGRNDYRRDNVIGRGVVKDGKIVFTERIPAPSVIDPNAWIEIVDEKTGKVLAKLRSNELYEVTTGRLPNITLHWSHVAVAERWPKWEYYVDRGRQVENALMGNNVNTSQRGVENSTSSTRPTDMKTYGYYPDLKPIPPEWDKYTRYREIVVVLKNHNVLDPKTDKIIKRDIIVPAMLRCDGDDCGLFLKHPIPVLTASRALFVDKKTGNVLAAFENPDFAKIMTDKNLPLVLNWAHVAVDEKWPGWEQYVDVAERYRSTLGKYDLSGVGDGGGVVEPRPVVYTDTPETARTYDAKAVANVPVEYKPRIPPEDVKERFDKLVEELKKVAEGVSWRNWEEKHREFLKARDELTSLISQYPSLFKDEVNETIGEVGRKISAAARSLEEILAKAAGRESFFADVGDGMKVAIGLYKVDPRTGAFHLVLREGENVVGYIRDGGEPVVTLRTRNMSEASTEYERLIRGEPDRELADRKPEEETSRRETILSPNAPPAQPSFVRGIAGNAAYIAHNVAGALGNVASFVTGAVTSALSGVGPLLQSAAQRLAAIVNPPLVKAATIEDTQLTFVKRPETAHDGSATSPAGYRPADYLVGQTEFVKRNDDADVAKSSPENTRPTLATGSAVQKEEGKKEPELSTSSTTNTAPPEQKPASNVRRGGGRHHAHMRLLMT